MALFWNILSRLLLIGLLTLITQVGGLVYLVYRPVGYLLQHKRQGIWKWAAVRGTVFAGFYLLSVLVVVPVIASRFGRVPLPWRAGDGIPVEPARAVYWLANRHYVKPRLRQLVIDTGLKLSEKEPGLRLQYLDAGFPFWDGYPLWPHLTHDDGRKVDLLFLYRDQETNRIVNRPLSVLGYGIVEGPQEGEYDRPAACASQGFWQYSAVSRITPQPDPERYAFDAALNKEFFSVLIGDPRTEKILIEPHLKTRLGLKRKEKIRYQGCHSVRHDDHVHLQVY